jgi:amidase/aspartyl-tRNA(Asn)/glutamyl-tRNA(Gln) amidotransferase subunit A
MGATERSIKGMRIGYSPNFDVFPVEPEVTAVIEEALKGFEEAGATVKRISFGLKRTQRELSDLWCRLMMPLNITGLLGMKAAGFDLLGKHRDDFPPEYLYWIDKCMNMTAVEFFADQAMRTEVYDAVQGAFADCDIIVTPTLACLPVKNLTNGETIGPERVNGEEVDRLIGWCLTYPLNFTGNPAASIPAGLSKGGLPVGMQIIGRRYADLDVIAASAAFERARPWAETYDICKARKI